jgi:hypothetical protein
MTAALSAELARALGWPRVELFGQSVFVSDGAPLERAGWFDYRDPAVCLPLIKWLSTQAPLFITDKIFQLHDGKGRNIGRCDTLEEAIARAVIAVRKEM